MQTFLKCSPMSCKTWTFPISFFVKNKKTLYTILYTITYLSKKISEHFLNTIPDHDSTQSMENINLIAIAMGAQNIKRTKTFFSHFFHAIFM